MVIKNPKIKYIDYGLGFTVSDKNKNLYIELNKNLNKRKYRKLKKQVLKHELLHWNAKSRWEDFKIDFLDFFNLKKDVNSIGFCITHPKSFLASSPIFIENKKIIPNYFMLGFWGFTLVSVSAIIGGIMFI